MASLHSNLGKLSAVAKVTNSCWHREFNTTGQTLPSEGESFLQSLRAARSHVTDLSCSVHRKPSDLLGVSNLLGGTGMGAPAGRRSLWSPGLLLAICKYIYKNTELWSRGSEHQCTCHPAPKGRNRGALDHQTTPRGEPVWAALPCVPRLRCPWTSLPPQKDSETRGAKATWCRSCARQQQVSEVFV